MSKKILIVDDSFSIRSISSVTLRKAGYEIIEASDGQDALDKIQAQRRIDLVITDLVMPRMGGLELVKLLKGTTAARFAPVVIVTTESAKAKKDEARAVGVLAWLTKPFEPKQLLATVESLLR
jgi:two-component system, chemotaxis family, chemotaxis protein CheY